MKKEWYTAKELVGLAGLPSSPQGINLMARREGWEHRRKRGVQGKAVEYHVQSLPIDVCNELVMSEPSVVYRPKRQDPFLVWMEAFYQLNTGEQERLVGLILRHGLVYLVSQLDELERISECEKGLESEMTKNEKAE